MKIFKSRPIVGVLLLAVSATAFGVMYLRQPKFGALPQGDRLALIEHSPNYRDGEFRNLIETPMRTGDGGLIANVLSMLADDNPNLRPAVPLPSRRVDLKALPVDEDVLV